MFVLFSCVFVVCVCICGALNLLSVFFNCFSTIFFETRVSHSQVCWLASKPQASS